MNVKQSLYMAFGLILIGSSLTAGLAFDTALLYTLNQSHRLKASLNEIEEREGERIQNGLYFNPLFSYTVENVFGNRDWEGWKSAESRYELSQVIEIGGQRQHRADLASYKIHAAQFEYCYVEIQAINALKKAFLEVAAAQELLNLAVEKRKIAQEISKAVVAKNQEGKIPLIECHRSELNAVDSELALQRAKMSLDVACCTLSHFWDLEGPEFDCVEYPFFQWECLPSLEECLHDHSCHPLLLKTQFEQLAACEEVKLEKANVVPNLIVTAGYKTIQNTKNKGVILGLAVPLSLFDRNQGSITRAKAKDSRFFSDYADMKRQLECKLMGLHKEAMCAYQELTQLKTLILTIAKESFSLVHEGYLAGKFEYIYLLDAQKTYFEAEERYIQALLLFYKKQTDIEYLTL